MDEERVIGPFTVKQFLFLAGGFGLAYLVHKFLSLSISIPLIALVVYVTFVLMKHVTPPHIDENYIKTKRYQLGSAEEYQRWLKQKVAVVQSQIAERQRKGFIYNPSLDRQREMFEIALRESEQ